MRISDWSSDVCSSDLKPRHCRGSAKSGAGNETRTRDPDLGKVVLYQLSYSRGGSGILPSRSELSTGIPSPARRSEEHTSELQSLMRISYAVFCLQKTKRTTNFIRTNVTHA